MYSSILNKRIAAYWENENTLVEEQNGFRPARSRDHVFTLTSVIQNCLNSKEPTFCAFIDLEKALDWINWDLVLHKLLTHGIDGKMYCALKRLLSKTKAKIILNEEVSTSWFAVESREKQGDPLSPTLFNIFINDLIQELKAKCDCLNIDSMDMNVLLYADDMVLICESVKSVKHIT